MNYRHTLNKSKEFSNLALKHIEQAGLLYIPYNYELWYTYYSKSHNELNRAIDILKESDHDITDERCYELHQRFLSQASENSRVQEAGVQITDTISEMTGRVHDVKSMAENYGEALENAAQSFSDSDNIDPQSIKETLNNVLDNTNDMIKHNAELEKELERSSSMMEELKRDLEKVRKQALTDGLTNLANRKAFDDEIERVHAEATKQGQVFTIIILDIDHFKSFNDNYGHQVGDQVLRLVAKTLTDGVKGRDMAARYGGEEFALILPDTNLSGGTKVADSLRKNVQGKELINRNNGEVLGRITMSGGVAEYSVGESIDQLIERADNALYSAKHNGRNQISTAKAPK